MSAIGPCGAGLSRDSLADRDAVFRSPLSEVPGLELPVWTPHGCRRFAQEEPPPERSGPWMCADAEL